MIISFSGYSFCKPHSASYARVSFQAAYLKTHYPAPFMAAVISNQGGFYATFAYVSEARRMGVKILGPDVGRSRIHWTARGNTIRVGLMAVKGLTADTMARIIQAQAKRPFASLTDFFARIRPREDDARALIHCGSLDRLGGGSSRATLLWAFSAWQQAKAKKPAEPGLFDQDDAALKFPDLPPDHPVTRQRQEYAVLGFLTGTHPITLFRAAINRLGTVPAEDIPAYTGRDICFAGWLITGKTVITKHGDPMKFLTFEDDTGIVETVFFPKPYAKLCHMLDYGRPYLLRGRVESDWGAVTLTVTDASLIRRN
ncbi:MAG TPA: DNA polymerase III subunit alpha, partial [Desulfobacteraceae bacterium]|nr:DNA polymerase III subunit alpha [Desulfobacteraceae bacterium]